jgi:hypothetical protein
MNLRGKTDQQGSEKVNGDNHTVKNAKASAGDREDVLTWSASAGWFPASAAVAAPTLATRQNFRSSLLSAPVPSISSLAAVGVYAAAAA